MCEHRSPSRWARTWDAWLLAAAGSLFTLEAIGLYAGGEDGTLTAHIRRAAGLSPRCHHGRLGRAALVAIFGWCIAHLAFGVLPSEGWVDRGRH